MTPGGPGGTNPRRETFMADQTAAISAATSAGAAREPKCFHAPEPAVRTASYRLPVGHGARKPTSTGRRRTWRYWATRGLIAIAALVLMASFMVGAEVIQRVYFPGSSVAVRHAVLTSQALVLMLATFLAVYLVMRKQQQALTHTAEQLTRVLESYQTTRSAPARFENPHLVHCQDVFDCERSDCPMHDAPGGRCWQAMALRHATRDDVSLATALQHCLSCEVYRRSCPDVLTELGESFNNLMFLLEEEARKVGRMRQHLFEKEKMVAIGQIASGIAHEIGNPLSSISSIAQMLKRGKSDSPMNGQIDLIEKHIQRISVIVRQLGKLAHPGVERWEPVDVVQTLDEAVRLISFDRRARGVGIRFEPPPPLPVTYGIRGQLQQVFINLLLNALDAMPDGGTLNISAGVSGRTLEFRFEDTGSGIDPAVGRRVFEPFFTTKDPGRGTGLGLAVSYGIIQKHGGSIDFDSKPGEGTIMIVQIPVQDSPPDP